MTNIFEEESENEKSLIEDNKFSIYTEFTYDTKIMLSIHNKEMQFGLRFWFDIEKINACFHGKVLSITMNNIYTIIHKKLIEIGEEFNTISIPITDNLIIDIMESHINDLLKYKFINAIQATRKYHGDDIGIVLYKNWP